MRVLGLDLGARRIGLAVSDADGKLAFPAGILIRQGLERDLAALRAIVEEREVERVVVGLPLHMSGREGTQAVEARRFAHSLAEATARPVELLDERWTTREAVRALRASGRRTLRRRGRGAVDSMAATILLDTYLERRKREARQSKS